MSLEGILTAFRMPAVDGKIKVKKCFNYRYPIDRTRESLIRRAEEMGTSFVDETLGIVIAKRRSLGKKS